MEAFITFSINMTHILITWFGLMVYCLVKLYRYKKHGRDEQFIDALFSALLVLLLGVGMTIELL